MEQAFRGGLWQGASQASGGPGQGHGPTLIVDSPAAWQEYRDSAWSCGTPAARASEAAEQQTQVLYGCHNSAPSYGINTGSASAAMLPGQQQALLLPRGGTFMATIPPPPPPPEQQQQATMGLFGGPVLQQMQRQLQPQMQQPQQQKLQQQLWDPRVIWTGLTGPIKSADAADAAVMMVTLSPPAAGDMPPPVAMMMPMPAAITTVVTKPQSDVTAAAVIVPMPATAREPVQSTGGRRGSEAEEKELAAVLKKFDTTVRLRATLPKDAKPDAAEEGGASELQHTGGGGSDARGAENSGGDDVPSSEQGRRQPLNLLTLIEESVAPQRLWELREEFGSRTEFKKHPQKVVDKLRAWFQCHFLWPYPENKDKKKLIRSTGLTKKELDDWFSNARRRHWAELLSGLPRQLRKRRDIVEPHLRDRQEVVAAFMREHKFIT